MVSHIIPLMIRIVIDTNVFVSALLSKRGSAFKLLELTGKNLFIFCLSVPLVIEYEDAANRILPKTNLTEKDLSDILDYLCMVGEKRKIHYLWRPYLSDPRDDMILELAVAAECEAIVTYNKKDFLGVEAFGINLLTPADLLRHLGVVS